MVLDTFRMDETEGLEEWMDEETDELFQLHTEYEGTENMLDSIREGLLENNIIKSKQEVNHFNRNMKFK